MFQHLQSRAPLRNVAPVHVPSLLNPVICEDGERYRQMMDETCLEEYYSEIEEFSFHSKFFPLCQSTASALSEAHKQWLSGVSPSQLAQSELLVDLAHQIEESASCLRTPAFFIRLSTRSPKDAVLHVPAFRSIFDDALKVLENAGDSRSSSQNNKLVALYQALTQSMRCTSGEAAVLLLITSARIQEDLEHYTGEGKTFQVIIREWFDFDVQHEFRAFIWKQKVTAITQYNEMCYFPDLHARKEEVQHFMSSTIEKEVLPKITKLPSLVLDIILCPNGEGNWILKVVEINPFAEFAGTGLFSWEKDKPTLMGRSPFEFRIQENAPIHASANIPRSMSDFLSAASPSL